MLHKTLDFVLKFLKWLSEQSKALSQLLEPKQCQFQKRKRRIRESGVGSEMPHYINVLWPVCDAQSWKQTYFQCGSKTGRYRRAETDADL